MRGSAKVGVAKLGLPLCVVVALLALPAAASAAEAPFQWQKCLTGSGAGQCSLPRGIGVDPNPPGHLYVADLGNRRIDELDAWGTFVKAWGWGVVASGPDNKPQNEVQEVAVSATGGSFALRVPTNLGSDFEATAPLAFNASAAAVRSALEETSYLNPGDLAVSGPAGGPWTIEFTGKKADADLAQLLVVNSTLTGGSATATVKTIQGGANYEICVPADGDICQRGQGDYAALGFSQGASPGELPWPTGVAVDSAGDVYVYDWFNNRVEKFDAEGNFLLMFGGGVDQGPNHPGNVCTAAYLAEGDSCGAGAPGAADGQFEGSPPVASYIAVGPGDQVYVGDKDRIQRFDTGGVYQAKIPLPESGSAAALAVDPSGGDLYLAYPLPPTGQPQQPSVYRLDATTGAVLDTLEVDRPTALAADASGDLYVVDDSLFGGGGLVHKSRVLEFDPAGKQISKLVEGEFEASTGIAVGSACFSEGGDVYLSNSVFASPFVRAFGPPPDNPGCQPPPAPPSIAAQFAVSVDTTGALLRAQINPHFFSGVQGETDYYLQYATAQCIEEGGWDAPCVTAQPASPAKLKAGIVDEPVTTARISLAGLEPATAYSYRFVAEGSGAPGEPVFGVGGVPGSEGEATTFRTFALPSVEPCPNDAFRGGASAGLPDCRAYELVSPLDKNGIDTTPPEFDQSAPDGDRIAYSTSAVFPGAASGPLVSQYLAERDPATGWSSRLISPPRNSHTFFVPSAVPAAMLHAFSPDLCDGWVTQDSDVPLDGGPPLEAMNLYLAHGLHAGCGEAGYERLIPGNTPPPNTYTGNEFFRPAIEGFSADGSVSVLRANGTLTSDAAPPPPNYSQLYAASGGELRLLSVLPDEAPAAVEPDRGLSGMGNGFRGDNPDKNNVRHALSNDGARAFWTMRVKENPSLYLRVNPTQPESDRLHGAASGKGDLIGPAAGIGKTTINSEFLTNVKPKPGTKFAAGQGISGENIPAGTTIVKVEEVAEGVFKLTLSAKATKTKAEVELTGAASEVVSNAKAETGAFEVGQAISGTGIPAGTTITAVEKVKSEPDIFKLTLSAKATKTEAAAALSATSDCTEADEKACTVPIAEGGEFAAADPSGSVAFYTSGGALYELDVDKVIAYEAGAASKVAGGLSPIDGSNSTAPVAGVAEDASRIYFSSSEDLGAGPNPEGDLAAAGQRNLYLYERGEGFAFVGTLLGGENEANPTPLTQRPEGRAARVSPDGLHLLVPSRASLTHYDNLDVNSGRPDSEFFLYDAAAGGEEAQLRCVSCNPSGARPAGRQMGTIQSGSVPVWAAARLPGWRSPFQATRAISDEGERVFFESFDALALADTNGVGDVYEWEAPGTGDCDTKSPRYSPQNGGCIGLISSGKSPQGSNFIDASADGSDVFFSTRGSLLPADPGLVDIYDAREEGGFAETSTSQAECEGEACQSPPAPPAHPTPASSALPGEGNVPPAPHCRRGQVRRGGRCVPRHRKGSRKHDRTKRHRHAKHDRGAAR